MLLRKVFCFMQLSTVMQIINLTPHCFTLFNESGEIVRVIPPTAPAARVASESRIATDCDGIPVMQTVYNVVEGLPDYQQGTAYIVSHLVQQCRPDRSDLYRPDTGPASAVRNAAGQVIGVKALAF
jgi:hypothetical protein